MLSKETVNKIFEMWDVGTSKNKISKELGISRSAVRDYIENGTKERTFCAEDFLKGKHSSYSYILGFYLGDGSISDVKMGSGKSGYRLRVFQDRKHHVITEILEAHLQILFPKNKISNNTSNGCRVSSVYNSHLNVIFPQHGSGMKHTRQLVLEKWQREIIMEYPREFLLGLFQSDGCYSDTRDDGLCYYNFTNESEDIKDFYVFACDLLGVEYTRPKKKYINHYRKNTVEKLRHILGDKFNPPAYIMTN